MIQTIHNVLDDNSCDFIFETAKDKIRYHYNSNTSNYTKIQNNNPLEYDVGQFTSPFIIDTIPDYLNRHHIKLFTPIVSKVSSFVGDIFVNRLKANILLKQNIEVNQYNTPHTDPGVYSFVYYLNDSDGDTFFFNEDLTVLNRVTPKKNTGVLFDSNILHASANPAHTDARFVLNFVFNRR